MHNIISKSWISFVLLGFHGEIIPHDSGLTSVIKGHGHYSPLGFNKRTNDFSKPEDTSKQMRETQGTAILLMRNPYLAIYGYRNYLFEGHKGIADVSRFLGKGKLEIGPKQKFVLTKIWNVNTINNY